MASVVCPSSAWAIFVANGFVTYEQKELKISALLKPVKKSEIRCLSAKYRAELLQKIAEGWDLKEVFDQPSVEVMCDLYPGAADATFSKYGELEGRRLGASAS